ncbi:hypothetical protein RJ640_025774 [Escallonia rubra]|uniref:Uncharacterized protein n=1 Tax=Escallonia rubra TaxID=112253 RepID=A0AA88RUB9_9ASTE|nr:hypothetical protein RJ640_025774 [Escallonia rubra]
MDQTWVSQVIKATLAENLSSGLEPHSLAELDTIAGQQLGEDASKGSKHGPSGDGDSPENGPKYLTRSGPYHGLPDETALLAVFLMETLPLPKSSDTDGATFTALPAKDGEERAMVEAAIGKLLRSLSGDKVGGISPGIVVHRISKVIGKWPSGDAVTFNGTHQDDLGGPNGQDALCVDQTWVSQVIKATLAENLSSGLEPHSLAELDTIAGQQLGEDASKGSKHGPSGVNHL